MTSAASTSRMPKIVYRCEKCSKPVRGDTGYIWVSEDERDRYRTDFAIWNLEVDANQPADRPGDIRIISGTAWATCPEPARWRVHHERCDPDPDDKSYWIEVGRADTHERLLSWMCHLVEKVWVLEETDWTDFVRAHLSDAALCA